MHRKNRFLYNFLFIFMALLVLGIERPSNALQHIYGINNPNAQTLPEKTISFAFTSFNNGGIQNKVLISIYDFFDIGVSFDIARALGNKDVEFHAPGAIGKIKFTAGTAQFPIFIAIGYDSFFADPISKDQEFDYTNTAKTLDEVQMGPYILITKPVYILGFEQFVNLGWRMPVQPDYLPNQSSFFLGFDIPLGKNFLFLMEVDRIFIKTDPIPFLLYNVGMRFLITENFYLSFYAMMGRDRMANRVVSIRYQNRF